MHVVLLTHANFHLALKIKAYHGGQGQGQLDGCKTLDLRALPYAQTSYETENKRITKKKYRREWREHFDTLREDCQLRKLRQQQGEEKKNSL